MKRKQGQCADCGAVKEIRARGLCSTCYSRRINVGYRFDGPPPEVGVWGYTGPCVDCGRLDAALYIRLRCRSCYERWKTKQNRQRRWRQLNEIRGRHEQSSR